MLRRPAIHEGILDIDRSFKARMAARRGRADALADAPRRQPTLRIRAAARRAAAPAREHLRPVVVKVRYHDRGGGAGSGMVRRLARYLEKEGPAFTAAADTVAAEAATAGWSRDRRVFHVIVSPNDGDRLPDARAFTRRYMAELTAELGPLDWVAAVEAKPDMAHPAGNRHVHLLVRGSRDGRDIVFDRAVVQDRFRHHAMAVATDLLGCLAETERRQLALQAAAMRTERARRSPRRPGRERAQPDGRSGPEREPGP